MVETQHIHAESEEQLKSTFKIMKESSSLQPLKYTKLSAFKVSIQFLILYEEIKAGQTAFTDYN
jgi:hypothetical protein